jgi:hypothetical protein
MNIKSNVIDTDKQIYNLLRDESYYSLGLNSLSKKLGVTKSYIRSLDHNVNIEFKKRFNDHINIFAYNTITYVGLESRRIAYVIDKQNGCNWVEKAISEGRYE